MLFWASMFIAILLDSGLCVHLCNSRLFVLQNCNTYRRDPVCSCATLLNHVTSSIDVLHNYFWITLKVLWPVLGCVLHLKSVQCRCKTGLTRGKPFPRQRFGWGKLVLSLEKYTSSDSRVYMNPIWICYFGASMASRWHPVINQGSGVHHSRMMDPGIRPRNTAQLLRADVRRLRI